MTTIHIQRRKWWGAIRGMRGFLDQSDFKGTPGGSSQVSSAYLGHLVRYFSHPCQVENGAVTLRVRIALKM